MDKYFSPDMLEFMLRLRLNNNKAFMQEYRHEYREKVQEPYYRLINALAPTMQKIDPQIETRPQKVLSRIFRDTRFSKDKSPYRDHHWIAFRKENEPREDSILYWFEIRVESAGWGIGFWGENRKALSVMRNRMLNHPGELMALLPILKAAGFALNSDCYKRMKVPAILPDSLRPWYTLKELYIEKQNVHAQSVFAPGFDKKLAEDFLAIAPVYRYLRMVCDLSKQAEQ